MMTQLDPSQSSPLLDYEQLQMLVEAGSPESYELFHEILELFEQECTQKLEEIQISLGSGDFNRVEQAAHALAGCSANIGGKELWLRAKDIENLCKSGRGSESGPIAGNLRGIYEQTLAALRAYAA